MEDVGRGVAEDSGAAEASGGTEGEASAEGEGEAGPPLNDPVGAGVAVENGISMSIGAEFPALPEVQAASGAASRTTLAKASKRLERFVISSIPYQIKSESLMIAEKIISHRQGIYKNAGMHRPFFIICSKLPICVLVPFMIK